jgi:rhodanese-related sulfurtransferase
MNMRPLQFLGLDLAGAALYIFTFFGAGFLFSGALGSITRGYQSFGRVAGWAVVLLIAGYVGFVVWQWIKARTLRTVPFSVPTEVAHRMTLGARVYDARSHGYFDAKAIRILGSRRLDPHTLSGFNVDSTDGPAVFVYCTCAREATSVRVARELQNKGIRVAVIKGGLRAWKRAGLPVESVPLEEMVALPSFR